MTPKKLFLSGILLVLILILTACGSNSLSGEIAVGNQAPDFTLTNSDGVQVSLSEYKGQPVLLFFHMAGG
jgi:cytochrome oxidase Cu insertion factor (SCO1/SenC/PrrC family)